MLNLKVWTPKGLFTYKDQSSLSTGIDELGFLTVDRVRNLGEPTQQVMTLAIFKEWVLLEWVEESNDG